MSWLKKVLEQPAHFEAFFNPICSLVNYITRILKKINEMSLLDHYHKCSHAVYL
jgi:hypothetical protein